jgi:uncharacterized protein (DUF342 family)
VQDANLLKMDKPIENARSLRINTNNNKIEAYITIEYFLDVEGKKAPRYTSSEIRESLASFGITTGIIEENLLKCTLEDGVRRLLIAKGEAAIDGQDESIQIKFDVDSDIVKLREDIYGKVDFKNIGAVNAMLKGDVIAVKIDSIEGIPGKDVFGEVLKPKAVKKIKFRASQGAELKDDNTIIASIDGKPCMKSNTFSVFSVHELNSDVDISTGNISFLGDIKINGSVREGMKVISGNSINISQNVESAVVSGKGDIFINGNIISSTIVGGGEDNEKVRAIEQFDILYKLLNEMITAIEEIKKFNLLGYDTSDGQIIKVLIDSKFRAMPSACMGVISKSIMVRNHENAKLEKLIRLIKDKLIGLNPIKIKHYSEILEIIDILKSLLDDLKMQKSIPVNVKLNYCQDSTIISTGDIIFSGKGAYISSITSQGSIYFLQDKSIVRGGNLKAENEIVCKIVGSLGGVTTKLMVSEKGHIEIATAHVNTMIYIGNKEFTLDYPCKDVHAYINENQELIVDRFRL